MNNYINKLNIAADIDGCLANFMASFLIKAKELNRHHELPKSWQEWYQYFKYDGLGDFSYVWDQIRNDTDFWLNIEPFDIPPFTPKVYVTARSIPSEITYQWLEKYNIPLAPVITIGPNKPKSEAIRIFEKEQNLVLDFFVEDLYENFKELNEAGIYCYLLDRPWNRQYNVGRQRIYSLKELL